MHLLPRNKQKVSDAFLMKKNHKSITKMKAMLIGSGKCGLCVYLGY